MKQKISVKNFRVFKETTNFEIRPLTLLVGPNNSGKSSFTKLLLLLKNGIEKLNFKDGQHCLINFNKVLCWNTESNILSIIVPNNVQWLTDDFEVHLSFAVVKNNPKIVEISVKNESEDLLKITATENRLFHTESTESGNNFFIDCEKYTLNININLLIQILYNKQLTYICNVNHGKKEFIEKSINVENSTLTFSNALLFNNSNMYDFGYGKLPAMLIANEIGSLEKDYLLYNAMVNNENITIKHKLDIQKWQKEIFEHIDLTFNEYSDNLFNWDLTYLLAEFIPKLNSMAKERLKERIISELNLTNADIVKITNTKLADLIFNKHKVPDFDSPYDYNFIEQLIQCFDNSMFEQIDYIGANRGSKEQILLDKNNTDIHEIFSKFSREGAKLYEEYFNQVLDIFNISGKIEVERFQDLVSAVFVCFDDKNKGSNGKVLLSDLGFGFSQLVPVLLKIITLEGIKLNSTTLDDNVQYQKQATLIIEEPEANLHPLLQSKLADFFALTVNYFPNMKFIIETHSEYLIRKLQLLVAKESISPEKLIIHYFNANEHVNANEPKVKIIEINRYGQLTENFGPGFFDEAINLKFDLMVQNTKLNKI